MAPQLTHPSLLSVWGYLRQDLLPSLLHRLVRCCPNQTPSHVRCQEQEQEQNLATYVAGVYDFLSQMPNDEPLELEALASTLQARLTKVHTLGRYRKQDSQSPTTSSSTSTSTLASTSASTSSSPSTSTSSDIVQQLRHPLKLRINPFLMWKDHQFERIKEVLELNALELAAGKKTKVSAKRVFMRVWHQVSFLDNQPPSRPLQLEQAKPEESEDSDEQLFKLRKVKTCNDLSRLGIEPPATCTEQQGGFSDDGGEAATSTSTKPTGFADMEDQDESMDELVD
ncbi:uncharacterized protein LOC117580888 [Drosophila guanche]|uniref:uncharacterized protein LOC117580888 n=1 Tax=Drosophila guanche TaxID=7266 RepID=UPI001470A739|nr:uncharacterized protein LOC117580888 [Drosophila guanche]